MAVYGPPCPCGMRTQRGQAACIKLMPACQSTLTVPPGTEHGPVERAARYIAATEQGETLTFIDLSEDEIVAAFARARELGQ